jgi:hypothetical protein
VRTPPKTRNRDDRVIAVIQANAASLLRLHVEHAFREARGC